MKKSIIAVLIVALALTGGTAFAAGNKIERGTSEFSVFTSIDTSESYASNTPENKSIDQSTSIDLRYGYFLTQGLQLGVSYSGSLSKSWSETNGSKDAGSESETQFTFLYLDLKYNFVFDSSQTVVPYLGVGLGTAATKSTYQDAGGATQTATGSGMSTALMGGLKFFITENTSFNVELRVDSFTYEPDIPGGGPKVEYTTDTVGMNLGLSVYF